MNGEKSSNSIGGKYRKKIYKTLFCFTFNATLGDFRLSLVAEKMKKIKEVKNLSTI